jgi:hypothetical protein
MLIITDFLLDKNFDGICCSLIQDNTVWTCWLICRLCNDNILTALFTESGIKQEENYEWWEAEVAYLKILIPCSSLEIEETGLQLEQYVIG